MAISDIVQYEREFPLELKHPKTGKTIGVTLMVRHVDCEAATAVGERMAAGILGDDTDKASTQIDLYAACISGWDWGGQEFENGKGVLEYSPENARYVMKHPSAKWIVRQVMVAVSKIGNFIGN